MARMVRWKSTCISCRDSGRDRFPALAGSDPPKFVKPILSSRQGNRIWSLRLLKAGSTSWGRGAINSDRGGGNAEEPESVRSFARRKGSSAVNHLPDFSYAIALCLLLSPGIEITLMQSGHRLSLPPCRSAPILIPYVYVNVMPLPSARCPIMLSMTEPPDEAGDERTFAISELADTFQVTPRTIRFYEDQGLLLPRRDGLNRVYSHRDRARLTLICRGKRLGFSLAEIKDFLDLYDVDDRQIEQMRFALAHGRERIASLEVQLKDVQQTLGELRALERQIIDHLAAAGAAPDSHTPVKQPKK